MKKLIGIFTVCLMLLISGISAFADGYGNYYLISSYDDPVIKNPGIVSIEETETGLKCVINGKNYDGMVICINEWPDGYTEDDPYEFEIGFLNNGFPNYPNMLPALKSFTVPDYVTFIQTSDFCSDNYVEGYTESDAVITVDGTYIAKDGQQKGDLLVNGTLNVELGSLANVTIEDGGVMMLADSAVFGENLTVKDGGWVKNGRFWFRNVIFESGSRLGDPETGKEENIISFETRGDEGSVLFEEGAEIERGAQVRISGCTSAFNGQQFHSLQTDRISGSLTVDELFISDAMSGENMPGRITDAEITCLDCFNIQSEKVIILDSKMNAGRLSYDYYPAMYYAEENETPEVETDELTEDGEEILEDLPNILIEDSAIDCDNVSFNAASCTVEICGESTAAVNYLSGSRDGGECKITVSDSATFFVGVLFDITELNILDDAVFSLNEGSVFNSGIILSEDAVLAVPNSLMIFDDNNSDVEGEGTILLIGEESMITASNGSFTDHKSPIDHIGDDVRVEKQDACEHEKDYHFTSVSHWLQCDECGIMTDYTQHEIEEDVINEADCMTAGLTQAVCETCGYEALLISAPLGHNMEILSVDFTEDDFGTWITYECHCDRCDEDYETSFRQIAVENSAWADDEGLTVMIDNESGCERICELYKKGKLVDTVTVPADEFRRFIPEEDGFDKIEVSFMVEDTELCDPIVWKAD